MGKFFEDVWNKIGDFTLAHLLPAVVLTLVGMVIIRLVLRLVKAMLKKSKLFFVQILFFLIYLHLR